MDKSFAGLVAYHLMNKVIFMNIFTETYDFYGSLNTTRCELHG